MKQEKLIRAFLFACTDKSEAECLDGLVFGTEKFYGPVVIRIRRGDLLFLNNIDTDTLFGVFRAASDGHLNKKNNIFGGRYPYQVRVEPLGSITGISKAKRFLTKHGLRRNAPLYGEKLAKLLDDFIDEPKQLNLGMKLDEEVANKPLLRQIKRVKESHADIDIDEEIPIIEATTFWDFPRQSYGLTPKGNNKYAGVTPALIIYNMVWRYSDPWDLVLDPMCGSGTTLDVCKEEKRKAIGYDISPTRSDIIQNDARNIPLRDKSVDMVFIDSPYGDNIAYSDHPQDIGRISSESEEFYDELEKVMIQCKRVLREGEVLGWLIGDQWVKGKFTPVGFKIYERLCRHFEPVEVVCIARRGQYSHTGPWYNRARRFNFFLRGFKYLIIAKKVTKKPHVERIRKIKWAYYERRRKHAASEENELEI